jgi:pSer/pThr/pTyr-binding forkhead associated (FHA) protein
MFSWFRRCQPSVKAALRIEGGPADGTELPVGKLPLTIGRSPDADLVLNDRWVSRLHCDLYLSGGTLGIHDRASRHGIMVNGQRVSGAVLHSGDRISLGMTTLVALINQP